MYSGFRKVSFPSNSRATNVNKNTLKLLETEREEQQLCTHTHTSRSLSSRKPYSNGEQASDTWVTSRSANYPLTTYNALSLTRPLATKSTTTTAQTSRMTPNIYTSHEPICASWLYNVGLQQQQLRFATRIMTAQWWIHRGRLRSLSATRRNATPARALGKDRSKERWAERREMPKRMQEREREEKGKRGI